MKLVYLGKIVSLIVEEDLNISHTVNIPRKDGKVIIEVQIDGSIDLPALKEKFESENIQVEEITVLQQKSFKKGSRKASFSMQKGLEQKMERNERIWYNKNDIKKGVFMDISEIRQKN